MEREAAKPTDLNSLPRGQRLSHMIDQEFHCQLNVLGTQLALTVSHQIDQLTPRHIGNLIQYRTILADPRAEGKLLIFIKFIDVSAQPSQRKKKAS
jgi:hypothetical protein